MKKSRIFAAVVYFIFTFGIGIVFALTLPGFFAAFTVPADEVEAALENGDMTTAMVLSADSFNKVPVMDFRFDGGGGIVLYEAVMEIPADRSSEEDSEKTDETGGMLYKCYMGYVYGVEGRYDVFAKENNRTSLTVTTQSGETIELPLLDYDADGNGTNDGVSNYTQNGFIMLELKQGDIPSVKKLGFKDKDGNETLVTPETDKNLDFQSGFFDCYNDMEGYNELVQRHIDSLDAAERDQLQDELSKRFETFMNNIAANENYVVSYESDEYKAVFDKINHKANSKAIPIIVVYFVVIYVIADFLLGTHYIIKFFNWFLFKVCRIPRKTKKGPDKKEVFGHDYYSMVTLKLDLSEVPDFVGSVEIKYTNSDSEAKFTLIKAEDYRTTQRIKAGTYVNPFIDINRNYAPVDLPDNLEVEGFQMEKVVKIAKRSVPSQPAQAEVSEQTSTENSEQSD